MFSHRSRAAHSRSKRLQGRDAQARIFRHLPGVPVDAPPKVKKPRLLRGSFNQVGRIFSNRFLLQIYQVKILLHFSALISVLERFFWLMFQFAERVAGITDDLDDGFHHFFHNAFSFWLRSFAAAQAFLVAGLTANCLTAPFMRPNFAFVIQNFQKSFLNVTRGKVEILMDVNFSE